MIGVPFDNNDLTCLGAVTEVVADLVVAAHADAKRKLDTQQAEMMREAAGPLAAMGLPGMPKF